jgi:hypothetical protein
MNRAATEIFIGTYSVRPLEAGEVYFCENGCGECQTLTIEVDEATVTDSDTGELHMRRFSRDQVSSCCHGDVGIWNDAHDVEVPTKYDFAPAESSNSEAG